MSNVIQTFDSFYKLTLISTRAEALRKRGFNYDGDYLMDDGEKPKDRGEYRALVFNESKGKACHVVYFLGAYNMDRERGYQYWIKEI